MHSLTLAILSTAVLLCAGSAGALTVDRDPVQGDPALECLERNLPERSMRRDFEVDLDTAYGRRTLRARSYWEREGEESKLRIFVQAPARIAKASVLLLWNRLTQDTFVYIPGLRRTRKIARHQLGLTPFGSELRFADPGLLRGLLERGEAVSLPESEVDGRPVWALETREPEGSRYARVRSYVDQETCVPLALEFYDADSDAPRATVRAEVDSIERAGAHAFAREITLTNHRDGSEMSMRVHSVEIDPQIPAAVFDAHQLSKTPQPAEAAAAPARTAAGGEATDQSTVH